MLKLDAILEGIYGSGKDEKDFAAMILKIRSALEDSFYEEGPDAIQQEILDQLEDVSARVRNFYA